MNTTAPLFEFAACPAEYRVGAVFPTFHGSSEFINGSFYSFFQTFDEAYRHAGDLYCWTQFVEKPIYLYEMMNRVIMRRTTFEPLEEHKLRRINARLLHNG